VDVQIAADERERFFSTLEADVAFLTGQNLMDYSLLLGIHDSRQADSPSSPSHGGGDPFSDSDGYEEEEEEELGERPGGARFGSPPGGAHARALPRLASIDQGKGPMEINPSVDVYAIKSSHQFEWTEMYFMALIDILTDYGVKKRTAQAAKTMKHGAGAEISTVPPDQYARRFLDFMRRAIK
jgi:1-phosphatidylinositol-5-phosphate 4-kinase